MSNTMEVPAQKSHSDSEGLPTSTLTPARALRSLQGADCYPEVTLGAESHIHDSCPSACDVGPWLTQPPHVGP